ncbi:uncharacterized protein [Panulirus ornatus]|uniref:uncharacterized protein n=1 Tax=Panulirus ornatus TaxID=150431 RepID=UPI003A897269
MSTNEEWNESLDNMDYLINCMENLEREDVIYLEEYLVGDGSLDSQSTSYWGSLTEEKTNEISSNTRTDEFEVESRGCVAEQGRDENPGNFENSVKMMRNGDGDNMLRAVTHSRSTRGVTKPKFVTYESFPAVKEKPFMCELCGLRLATRESRRRHILAKHIKERTNLCNICGKAFIFKFALRAHRAVHSETPNFICVCGMTFTVRASYMDHIKRIHRAASEIKYPCELCFKSFGDRHTLRLHLISVHKTKTIVCTHNGCDKIFSTIGLMRSHYRYHLKERFACDECGQSFSTESYMYKHRLTHSGIRPYVCVDCGKTYLSVSHLNKHRRSAHSSLRPFQCAFCGKCYKTKDQLTYHESSHKGEKPFQCEVCGYASAYRNTYYAHKKKHHLTSITNEAHGINQKKSYSFDNVAVEISDVHEKVKDKRKVIKKSSSLLKSKSEIDIVFTEKKSCELTPSQMLDCNTKSLPLITTEGVSRAASKDSVSPCACNSPLLDVICVVSTGSGSATGLPQELPVAHKALSKSTVMESISENRDIRLMNNRVPSSSVHQTNVHSKDSKMSVLKKDLAQNDVLQLFDMPSNKDNKSEEYFLSSEKQNLFVILSNNGKCAVPTCDSIDDSLLLSKIGDNSYIGVCNQHTFSDHSVESQKDKESIERLVSLTLNVRSLEGVSSQIEDDSRMINNSLISTGSTNVCLTGEGANILPAQDQQQLRTNDQMTLVALPNKHETQVLHSDSAVPETSDLVTEVSRGHSSNAIPVSDHTECIKSISGEICPAEFTTIMELDPGVNSLSGHVVDDSFSLAQIEVVCPICDEQFLCMDAYVTHLESSHN